MIPFPLTKEQFEAQKSSGEIKPDALFPIMDYEFCKQVWETSPLIQDLCNVFKATK